MTLNSAGAIKEPTPPRDSLTNDFRGPQSRDSVAAEWRGLGCRSTGSRGWASAAETDGRWADRRGFHRMRTLMVGALALHAVLGCASVESSNGPDASSTEDSCPDLEARARTLLASAQTCASAADCAFASFDVDCLPQFLCDPPVSVETDQGRLEQRARALSVDFQAGCGCAFANCASREVQELRCVAGRCAAIVATEDEDGGWTSAPE